MSMKYINGNDLPFEMKQIIFDAIEKNEPIIMTTINGELYLIPKAEFQRMQAGNDHYHPNHTPTDDFDFMNRDEVDF